VTDISCDWGRATAEWQTACTWYLVLGKKTHGCHRGLVDPHKIAIYDKLCAVRSKRSIKGCGELKKVTSKVDPLASQPPHPICNAPPFLEIFHSPPRFFLLPLSYFFFSLEALLFCLVGSSGVNLPLIAAPFLVYILSQPWRRVRLLNR